MARDRIDRSSHPSSELEKHWPLFSQQAVPGCRTLQACDPLVQLRDLRAQLTGLRPQLRGLLHLRPKRGYLIPGSAAGAIQGGKGQIGHKARSSRAGRQ
jgi:hypothetical protein